MKHEYKSSGYEQARRPGYEDRGYEDRDMDRSGRYRADEDRERYGTNTPTEWEGRRYGRDFNDDPNDGGRGIYSQGARSGQAYGREGSSQLGGGAREWENPRAGGRVQPQYESTPRNTYGSSRYAGGDFSSGDYDESEHRYSTPYSDQSGNRVVGSNWTRTGGSGEWSAGYSGGSRNQSQNYGSQAYGSAGYGSQNYGTGGYRAESGQSFRGRGPKQYVRSDERLKEIACELLTDAPEIDASEIAVEVKNGEITLSGTVTDRKAKYAAEDLLESRAGVKEINNQLRIKSRSESGESGGEVKQSFARSETGSTISSSSSQGKQDGKRDYGSGRGTGDKSTV